MSNSKTPTNTDTPQELPAGFVPGDHDVVIGKGKKFYFHTGNQWLRTLVASMLDEYKQAQTKSDKSNIISDVVEYVRQHGRFVKRDLKSGKWIFAEPLLCREKCSQTFRDNLAETYRSSNVAKRNKRRAEQQEKKRVPEAKRMRMETVAPPSSNVMPQLTHPGMPQLNGMVNLVPQLQQQHQQAPPTPAPIPANLFDMDMPLWTPKSRTNSLGLGFAALTRGSITGTAGGDNGLNLGQFNAVANNNLNAQAPAPGGLNLSGLNGVNLMQNLPDILSNLTQLVSHQNNQAAAPQQQEASTPLNPFEPTPLTHQNNNGALPPLTGTVDSAVAAMPTIDLGQLFEPRPMAEKRHSLALAAGFDWLAAANNINNGNTTQQEEDPKISAAFAA